MSEGARVELQRRPLRHLHAVVEREREREKKSRWAGRCHVPKLGRDVRKDGVKEVRTESPGSICLCPPPRVADDGTRAVT